MTIFILVRKNFLKKKQKCLKTYNLPRQNQEVTKSLNRPITNKKFEGVIKKLPAKKIQGPDSLQVNSNKHLKN